MELVSPTVSRKKTNLNLRHGNSNRDRDGSALGQGAFSTVKDDRTDPHMVKKHHYSPITDNDEYIDGYVKFVNYLIANEISFTNLPRIYNVKKIIDKNKQYIYTYQLEKLIPCTAVDVDELIALYKRTVKANLPEQLHQYDDTTKAKEIVRMMGRIFETAVMYNDYDRIKDESVIETLKVIARFMEVASDDDLGLDMSNSGNLMFRRGPYGIQLVITDPF